MPTHPQDNAWKNVLNRYFPEFVAFFFPQIYAEVDWRRGYEFLEQELAQLARDQRVGRRLADKLVRVSLARRQRTMAAHSPRSPSRCARGLEQARLHLSLPHL